MKVNTKSFPHPVLGNEDDVGGEFKVHFKYELSKAAVILNPSFVLKNKAIEELLKKGKASFITEVQCKSTFFRESFADRQGNPKFTIPASRLRERVTVGFYVCADAEISDYAPTDPHPDYDGAKFDLEPGDVLAVGGDSSFNADKTFDPLRPPVSSFMSIREGLKHEGPVEVDYTDDKIAVVLSKSDWHNYMSVRGQKTTEGVLHASVVLPVLIDAVHQVKQQISDYEDANWYVRIQAILEARGLNNKTPFEIAQKILENPINRGFKSLNEILDSADDESYE